METEDKREFCRDRATKIYKEGYPGEGRRDPKTGKPVEAPTSKKGE